VLDASPSEEAPVVVGPPVALSEKVPDPELRPHGFSLEVGELIDLDETLGKLVAAGYERVDQVEDRGQFAGPRRAARHLPGDRGARRPRRALDIEIESLRWFSHLHPALARRGAARRDRARRRARAEHRELAEIAALEDEESRPDVAELLPGRPLPRAARCSPSTPTS
jgi:transcription-repair coupling factor (superfamily II helicase)